jgi:uncharacterized membrane protein
MLKVCPATVMVPVRAGPVLAATEKLTVPLPVPVAPAVMVIQASLLVAVQAQPAAAVTLVEPAPPAAAMVWLAGLMENVQPDPCETEKVCPATVIVPVRAGPVLAAAEKLTVPSPLPLAPAVMVIQASLLVAVQVQPAAAVTLVEPAPPAAAMVWLAGLMENVQPDPCETEKVCPATVIVPVRAGPVLAAAEKLTVPLPVPVAPAVMVIQASLLVAVQAQPAAAVTLVEPAPPAAAMVWLVGLME